MKLSVGQMVLWFALCFLVGGFPAFMLGMRTKTRDLERRMARQERKVQDLEDRATGGSTPRMRPDGSFIIDPTKPYIDKKEAKAMVTLLRRMRKRLNA